MIFPVACAPDILTMNMTHTGELGYVFYIPNEFALHVYDSILEAGKGGRGSAVGLQKKSLFGVTNGPVITGFEELPSFSRLPVILQYFVATANCKMVKNKTSFIHKNCSGVEPIFRSSSSIFFEIEKLTTRSRCWSWTFGWVPVTARKGRLRFGISLFFCLVPRYNRYPVPKEHYLWNLALTQNFYRSS